MQTFRYEQRRSTLSIQMRPDGQEPVNWLHYKPGYDTWQRRPIFYWSALYALDHRTGLALIQERSCETVRIRHDSTRLVMTLLMTRNSILRNRRNMTKYEEILIEDKWTDRLSWTQTPVECWKRLSIALAKPGISTSLWWWLWHGSCSVWDASSIFFVAWSPFLRWSRSSCFCCFLLATKPIEWRRSKWTAEW